MPPEPLPFDRKDVFKERKPSSSDPVGVVPARWREPPTTPSSHPNNHGLFSYRWGGAAGSSDLRRPISGHGKHVGGGWHVTTVESGPLEDKFCRNDSNRENNHSNCGAVLSSSQTDRKVGNCWDITVSPNGNSHLNPDSVNSWDQLQFKDQHDKDNGDGVRVSTAGGQRLESENSLGSSIDWKPIKWIRSGSLSSRGSGFSHSSSSKSIGVDSLDTKIDVPTGNSTPLQSPSGDAVPCLTPRTLADEVSSRKKPRLGWGEGLAKYEKKKVGPDDIVDKNVGARNGMIDGIGSLETLLTGPTNVLDKSPSSTGCSECASPATPYSFACSSSPGVEEKASVKAAASAVDNGICNPSVPSCNLSRNQTDGYTFNLENLELTEGLNFSSLLNELIQSDDTSAPASGFVRSTAMDKLQVWKADISRTLEIAESEIDSLENELKSLISDVGGSCSLPTASCSLLAECYNDKITKGKSGLFEKADRFVEQNGVEDLDTESPGTATSKFVEPFTLCNNFAHSDAVKQNDSVSLLDVRSENAEAAKLSQDVVTACGDGSQIPESSTVPIGGGVHFSREDKLYELILASNKVLANEASHEFSNLLPSNQQCSIISRDTNDLLLKEKFSKRKCFLKFKERVITLKFRAFQYLWKEDLRLLSVRRFGARSQKKFELSSRMGYADYQKHRSSIRSRFSSPAGNLSLVPTTEIIDYANKLLSDSRVRIYRNTLKMPSLILDKRERMRSRFISDNGLVENPCEVEKEKSVVNPWTSEEKEIFLDKFSLFGKDFRKIASFLEHKTVADCVEYYYKNHKSDRFQNTKKNPEFAKQGKSHSTNRYMVTTGKRWNRETNAASLDMLGAVSAMAANIDCGGKERQRKFTPKFEVGTSKDHKPSLAMADGGILERSSSLGMPCNEREAAAADVLAGICGSISSEALSSCITSLVDFGDVHHQDWICQKQPGAYSKRRLPTPEGSSLNDVDEETCSDDSCGKEMESSDWTDEEKSSFIEAVRIYGKDFVMISRCMRTRTSDQCRVFFSKSRKCLGLDGIVVEPGSYGNQGGGNNHDHEDACMVDSGSVVSHDKSSGEGKTDVEDLHSSDFREEHDSESDRNVVIGRDAENESEAELDGNLEGAADSEAANVEEALQNTCSRGSAGEINDDSPSASGARVETEPVANVSSKICRERIRASDYELPSIVRCPVEDHNSASCCSLDLSMDHGSNMKSDASEKVIAFSEDPGNGFLVSNLFPRDPTDRKTLSQDDVSLSSRLSFRKSNDRLSQRSSSTEGYHLHLPKQSLLDCVESSQILRGYPVTSSSNEGRNRSLSYNEPRNNFKLDLMDPFCPPRDGSMSQEQKQCSHSDVEKSSRSGDVKLFGQILTNSSSRNQSNSATHIEEKTNGGRSFNLKFDNHSADKRSASVDLSDQSSNYSYYANKSYGYWDGHRIQAGFPSFSGSAMLLAKYPAAFSNAYTSSKLDHQLHSSLKSGNEKHKTDFLSGFHTRKVSNNSGGADYRVYGSTVDKLLLPEMPRLKEQGSIGGGSCNGGVVSDPVAAIRMHYAKIEEYKNGREGESWRR